MTGPGADEGRLAALAGDTAAFALDLHRHLAAERGGNTFLSPYSISVALAMAYAGARGETRRQMEETLHYTQGEAVHPALAELGTALGTRETTTDPVDDADVDAFRLEVADALWGLDDYPFADGYLALLDEHYDAGLRRADFADDPEGERERIDEWVADRTGGRIEDLLPPGALDPATRLVLTDAVYFLAAWEDEFRPENTEDGTFTALDGTESTVPFMQRPLDANYASVAGWEAVELPYVGEEVSMVLLLPEAGSFEAFERDLDGDRLLGIFDALGHAAGHIALPRFEFETSVRLSDALGALGMADAFRPGANFDGMVAGTDVDLWIDEVYHETFVSVDEEGTEAAAATATVGSAAVADPRQFGELRFDRPFLFCIRDRPTDAVLFLGRVVDAGAAQDGQ